ncbi:MAG: DNA recombination protein RmuC [Firmicutes bacterium]|nr:DNA recombination protein RmuC [Bacillota bacterium]
MSVTLVVGIVSLVLEGLLVVLLLSSRKGSADLQAISRLLREEAAQSRDEALRSSKLEREEMQAASHALREALLTHLTDKATQQQQVVDIVLQRLVSIVGDMATQQRDRFDGFARETGERMEAHSHNTRSAISEMSLQQKSLLDTFSSQLTALTQMNEQKLDSIRQTVDVKLSALQEDNSRKLEQMRMTVDEKLHASLERRLGESFKLVSDRLEIVHKGLGEMQTLAAGVGDLKRVLTNVKMRGTLGEIQLETLLEQLLSPEQYSRNVALRAGSAERVDFAIALPGQGDANVPVWLPIDAKFPMEDYQRLLEAQEQGDVTVAAEAARQLEARIRQEAKSIQEKYIQPPLTTDFALLFLPIEGLFAEMLRRSGLWETLQRDYRVVITGPTTITALLNSLQMGFRTLSIQKRSSEVWQLLGSVKSEFSKFGDVLEKTQKKLQEASRTIDDASVRTRAIERKLRSVEVLPSEQDVERLADEGSVG